MPIAEDPPKQTDYDQAAREIVESGDAGKDMDSALKGSPGAGVQPWRLYEMSEHAVELTRAEDAIIPFIYVKLFIALLFLFGAGMKYRSYKREV
jgi:hypothetical protein